MTTRAPFKPDQVVVAITSFGHARGDVAQGTRLRGDDPIAVKYAPYFVPLGEDTPGHVAERHAQLWPMAPPPPAPSAPVQTTPPAIDDQDAVVAIRGVEELPAGTIVDKRHQLVRTNPDKFVPMACGVPRERARVATQAIKWFGASGEDGEAELERHIHVGQWVDADDPMVATHPTHFVGLEET